jgi:predicted alpha/beta-hydrolase family hydrolase
MNLDFTISLAMFGSGAKMRGLIRKQVDRLHVSCAVAHGAMGSQQQPAIFAVAFLLAHATLHLDFELRWMRTHPLRIADDHPHINSIPLLSLLC